MIRISPGGAMDFNGAATQPHAAIAYRTNKYRVALNVNNLLDRTCFVGPFRVAAGETTLSYKYCW